MRRFFFPKWERLGWSVAAGRWVDRLGWLPVYRRVVWMNGKSHKQLFVAWSKPAALMTKPNPVGTWFMGRKEFEQGECKGNKWLVPTNRELDLSRE